MNLVATRPRYFRPLTHSLASDVLPSTVQAMQRDVLHPYSAESCQRTVVNQCRPGLRSGDSIEYWLPRRHSELGERVFYFAGPLAWNKLQ